MKQIENKPLYVSLRSTPFGPVAALWSVHGGEPKICRIVLSKPGSPAKQAVANSFPDSTPSSCSEIDTLVSQIEIFMNGEDIQFPLDIVSTFALLFSRKSCVPNTPFPGAESVPINSLRKTWAIRTGPGLLEWLWRPILFPLLSPVTGRSVPMGPWAAIRVV